MSNIEVIAFIASIASLVLAIVAIWLSFHHKKESDSVNEKTKELLLDVHSDAKTISAVAMPELKKYGEAMRKFVFKEQSSFDSESLADSINKINKEIKEIKKSNGLSDDVLNKLSHIEKTLKQKATENEKQENGTYLSIDGSYVGHQLISTPIHQFETIQDLLDMIWISMLSESVPAYTYGKTWYIFDKTQSEKLSTKGKGDERSLREIGVTPESFLVVRFT